MDICILTACQVVVMSLLLYFTPPCAHVVESQTDILFGICHSFFVKSILSVVVVEGGGGSSSDIAV